MSKLPNQEYRKKDPIERANLLDPFNVLEDLRALSEVIVPVNASLRKTFEICMPVLYILRNKGCSWDQITKALNDEGVKLQCSTVRQYFSEMLADRSELCHEALNSSLIMLSKARKITDNAMEAERIQRIVENDVRQRREAAARFVGVTYVGNGQDGQGNVIEHSPQQIKKKEIAPAIVEKVPAAPSASAGGYGLLNGLGKAEPDGGKKIEAAEPLGNSITVHAPENLAPLFSPVTNEEKEDKNKIEAAQPLEFLTQTPVSGNEPLWKCCPLPVGVGQLNNRDRVPDEVYQEGLLEHPAIPGLFLTKNERLFKPLLEIINTQTGEKRFEKVTEKPFRVGWTKPIPVTKTSTDGDFVRG